MWLFMQALESLEESTLNLEPVVTWTGTTGRKRKFYVLLSFCITGIVFQSSAASGK